MGAPGKALFCEKGHLFHWISDDLYWTDDTDKELETAKTEGCPCGNNKILVIDHYGGINDCICLESEVLTKGIKPTSKRDTVIALFKDACDVDGNPMVAYHKIKLDIYKIPKDVWSGKVFDI